LRVLDAGCGNGRFARFLAAEGLHLAYTGVDFSPALLAAAGAALCGPRTAEPALIEADFVSEPGALPAGPFDLVALFGVLHHVPGRARRAAFTQALAERVAPGGLLAFTAWRFDRQPRFADHRVLAPPDLALEPGDALLDWRAEGVQAIRYCHALDDTEIEELVAVSGLALLDGYAADGQTGDLNEYRVLKAEV
jgi:SAM-dependent methyltransferase